MQGYGLERSDCNQEEGYEMAACFCSELRLSFAFVGFVLRWVVSRGLLECFGPL